MAILASIVVTEDDLLKVMPNLNNFFKFEGQSLDDVIETAKRTVYREIKEHEQNLYPGYTDAEIESRLENVKDYEDEQALKDRITLTAIAELMSMNQVVDQADFYLMRAKKVPLHYWVDVNTDGAIGDSEARTKRTITFGR